MKLISIIIPCYHVKDYIHKCVDSLLNQTIGSENLEIIMVDDGSTKDNTWELLQNIEKDNPQCVIAIHNDENHRLGTARNTGMKYASAKYVMYLDADDWLELDCLEKMYQVAQQHNAEIVTCNFYRDFGDGRKAACEKNKQSYNIIIDSIDKRKELLVNDMLQTRAWGKLIRRDFLLEHEIVFPDDIFFEDIPWSAVLYLYAKRICLMKDIFYHYYVNLNSAVLKKDQTYFRDAFDTNYFKWNELVKRNAFSQMKLEYEFDFLVNFYLMTMKMFGKRYTCIPQNEFREMQQFIRKNIPDYEQNPYIKTNLAPEISFLFQFIKAELSEADLAQLHTIIQKMNL